MPGKDRVRNRAELEASNELRLATDQAAALIRKNVGLDWSLSVSSSHREYSMRRAPYVTFEGEDAPGRPGVMTRLIVSDEADSTPRGITRFYVLELPPRRVGDADIQLRTGVQEDLSEAFLPAKDFACMRFWIDVAHELGTNLRAHLASDGRDLLYEYAQRAKVAAASVVEARRDALGIDHDGFAQRIDVPIERVFEIENASLTITAPLLDRIEVTFAGRERSMGFTPHEMSPRLGRLLSVIPSPRVELRRNGATHVRSVPDRVQSAPQLSTELPMLVEPPEGENLNPPDWEGGAKLRAQRKTRRVSLAKFAAIARMNPTHVSRLERGDLKMTPEVQQRFKLTLAYLDAPGSRALA
jgi:hypothetical protein